MALYHDRWGYYVHGDVPGRAADYFTSVSVGPCFGELLAVYCHQVWQSQESPENFVVLEQGGHHGTLAADILQVISAKFPAFYACLRFLAVEKSSHAMSDSRLQDHPCWQWMPALEKIPSNSVNLAFSNELLDAFPVHRVRWHDAETGWEELYVTVQDDPARPLAIQPGPLSSPALLQYLSTIDTRGFEPGYTTEANMEVIPWLEEMARVSKPSSRLLIIDYGFPEEAYYAAGRREGTLQARHRHRPVRDPLARPGEQDLTAHVNFTRVEDQAKAVGFEVTRFEEQPRFLTSLARKPLTELEQRLAGMAPDAEAAKWIRQFQQLISMGPAFKAMELTKTA